MMSVLLAVCGNSRIREQFSWSGLYHKVFVLQNCAEKTAKCGLINNSQNFIWLAINQTLE